MLVVLVFELVKANVKNHMDKSMKFSNPPDEISVEQGVRCEMKAWQMELNDPLIRCNIPDGWQCDDAFYLT